MPFMTKVIGDKMQIYKENKVDEFNSDDNYYDPEEKEPEYKEFAIGVSFLQFLELDFSGQEAYRQYVIQQKDAPKFFEERKKLYEKNNKENIPTLRTFFRRPTSDGIIHENSVEQEVLAELASSVYDFHYHTMISKVENHPYWRFRVVNKYYNTEPWKVILDYSDFTSLQAKYMEMLWFCCDVDNKLLSELTPLQRYYIYCVSGRNSREFQEMNVSSSFHLSPSVKSLDENVNLFYKSYDFWSEILDSAAAPAPITPALIEFVKKLSPEGSLCYSASSPAEYACLEFSLMIERGIRVRKCKNCGRYFILKGNYGTLYCDRIPEGKKQNCQSIGAASAYKARVEENEVLKMYNKAYKRYYAQAKKKKINMSDFEKWSRLAQEKRQKFKKGIIQESELATWLAEDFSRAIRHDQGGDANGDDKTN